MSVLQIGRHTSVLIIELDEDLAGGLDATEGIDIGRIGHGLAEEAADGGLMRHNGG